MGVLAEKTPRLRSCGWHVDWRVPVVSEINAVLAFGGGVYLIALSNSGVASAVWMVRLDIVEVVERYRSVKCDRVQWIKRCRKNATSRLSLRLGKRRVEIL